jgi:excisionase family DNA binding protein
MRKPMSFILLIIGLILFFMKRLDVGTIQSEGRPLKAAGVILATPGVVTLLLAYVFLPLAMGRNEQALVTARAVVDLLDLIATIVAVALAYLLIVNPPDAPRLPGLLGEIQADNASSVGQQVRAEREKIITISEPEASPRPKISINRDKFPSVMNLNEAARYLQTTEEEILKMIDDGRLVAARDNYNYQIAKSQLDELL